MKHRQFWVFMFLFVIGAMLAGAGSALATTTTSCTAGICYAAPEAQGNGNCSSWANACTLQTALTGALSGDEI